jgi:hypothetical protein
MSSEDKKSDRLYVIMTDSPRVESRHKIARKKPACSKQGGFWTADSPDDVWQMSYETASEVISKIRHNNPRMMRAEKAKTILENQQKALLKAAEEWEARKANKRKPENVSPEPENNDTPEP